MAHSSKKFAGLLLALISLLSITPAFGGELAPLFAEHFDKALGDRWKPVSFGDLTDYQIVTDGTNPCLRASAKSSASALATKIDLKPTAAMTIRWRWKISACPTNGSEDTMATFDHTARIFVAFDTFIGPPRTINYVWANTFKTNAVFDHPNSGRSKFIVIESGNQKAGQWLPEERDLKRDWQTLFKEEKVPKIVGVGVLTDSDGTRTSVTGWYGDIVIEGR